MNNLYNEKYRLQYHFTSKKNWINDPDGLIYYKGTYHLFYQYQPDMKSWGPMYWGHATSTDMLHWEEQEVALTPKREYSIFSGCAVVDKNNTSGLKTGTEDLIVFLYTAYPRGQWLAYSNDGCKTLEIYGPVLANLGNDFTNDQINKDYPKEDKFDLNKLPIAEDRDPKVFWHEETQKWVMILWSESYAKSGLPSYCFFSSNNLIDWEYMSELAGYYEMPDFVKLPVNGDKSNYKWVVLCPNGDYEVGDFDGYKFISSQPLEMPERSYTNLSVQTWQNMPDDRCVMLEFILREEELCDKDTPFMNQHTIPMELSLRLNNGKYELLKNPIRELETLREEIFSISDVELKQGEDLFDIECDVFDMEVELYYNPFARINIILPNGILCYISQIESIDVCGKQRELKQKDNTVKFRILCDRSSIELFADDGNVYMPYHRPVKTGKVKLWPDKDIKIKNLKIYKIKSVWNK